VVTRRTQAGSKGLQITVYGGAAGPDDETGGPLGGMDQARVFWVMPRRLARITWRRGKNKRPLDLSYYNGGWVARDPRPGERQMATPWCCCASRSRTLLSCSPPTTCPRGRASLGGEGFLSEGGLMEQSGGRVDRGKGGELVTKLAERFLLIPGTGRRGKGDAPLCPATYRRPHAGRRADRWLPPHGACR